MSTRREFLARSAAGAAIGLGSPLIAGGRSTEADKPAQSLVICRPGSSRRAPAPASPEHLSRTGTVRRCIRRLQACATA